MCCKIRRGAGRVAGRRGRDPARQRRGSAGGRKEVKTQAAASQRVESHWRLIPFFELFMSCPKDELRQWYELFLTYSWYKLCITIVSYIPLV